MNKLGRSALELPELVRASQQGDDSAYAELMLRFSKMAHGFAFRYLRDYHLAQDVVQEAFFEAYRCLQSLQEPAAFPAWFKRIVFKHCDRIVRVKKIPTVSLGIMNDPPSAMLTPEDAVRDGELRGQIYSLLQSLPPHERIVTALYHLNGYSQEEIARIIEVPISTVKNRLRSSRLRLRENKPMSKASRVRDAQQNNRQRSQAVISDLLTQPRPLEISGHPVRVTWDELSCGMREYDVVGGGEIEDRCDVVGHTSSVVDQFAFFVNGKTILRPQMFDTAIMAARERRPPFRIMAPGRVYTLQTDPAQWASNEADGLVLDDDYGSDKLVNHLSGVLAGLLGGARIEVRHFAAPFIRDGWRMLVRDGSQSRELAGGGILKPDVLARHGFQTDCASPLVFGLRLDNICRSRYGAVLGLYSH